MRRAPALRRPAALGHGEAGGVATPACRTWRPLLVGQGDGYDSPPAPGRETGVRGREYSLRELFACASFLDVASPSCLSSLRSSGSGPPGRRPSPLLQTPPTGPSSAARTATTCPPIPGC